jgi:hypothetical protein
MFCGIFTIAIEKTQNKGIIPMSYAKLCFIFGNVWLVAAALCNNTQNISTPDDVRMAIWFFIAWIVLSNPFKVCSKAYNSVIDFLRKWVF